MKLYIIWNYNYKFKAPEYFKTLRFFYTSQLYPASDVTKEQSLIECATRAAGWEGKIHDSHRITQCLRLKGPLEFSHPTLLLTQGHLEQPAQDCVQVAFTSLQGWRLHQLSGQPVPVFGPTELNTLSFTVISGNLLRTSCSLLAVQVWQHWKSGVKSRSLRKHGSSTFNF